MPFVSRDSNTGRVNGLYACKQYPEMEWLEDDHSDVNFFKQAMQNPDILLTMEEFTMKEIEKLDVKVREFVYSKYPAHRQLSLTKLQTDARMGGKDAAATYLDSCWSWMQTCFMYYYQLEDVVTTIAKDTEKSEDQRKTEIIAIISAVDFSSLEATDPKVTIRHAMELLMQ